MAVRCRVEAFLPDARDYTKCDDANSPAPQLNSLHPSARRKCMCVNCVHARLDLSLPEISLAHVSYHASYWRVSYQASRLPTLPSGLSSAVQSSSDGSFKAH